MSVLGYCLAGEDHPPEALLRHAELAEEAGFGFAFVSDHFHPWNRRQGHSPFVWSLLGALSQRTRHLELGTAVSCPGYRMHPAVLAQAAATTACLLPGRFFLGLGSGERLNEQAMGGPWPPPRERLERLEESVGIIRSLLSGQPLTHRGRYYATDQAWLFDLPSTPIPLYMAASGPRAAALAGRLGLGLIGLTADEELVSRYRAEAGPQPPTRAQLTVCWDRDLETARRLLAHLWPVLALEGTRYAEVGSVEEMEAVTNSISVEEVAACAVCGPDPSPYLAAIEDYRRAGFQQIAIHQVGPNQAEFLDFCRRELLPATRE